MIIQCFRCGGCNVVKNGKNRHKMQNYKCKECGRQFSLHPDDDLSPRIRGIVIRLLLHKVSVEVITSAVEISKQVVLDYKKKVGKLWDV